MILIHLRGGRGMGDHGELSKEDPLKAWREAWLKADYSWDGLLDPEKETEGFDSLQAYWRTDPETGKARSDDELKALGELIAVEGQKTYHLAHLPLYYPDGAPTLKTTAPSQIQDQLGALLRARLVAAAPVNESEQTRPPASLQGVVFLGADYSRKNFDSAVNARFVFCLFSKGANFNRAAFSEDADFEGAAFSGDAYFTSAAFSGDANFRSAAFSGYANFSSAAFSEDADFEGAAFSGDAYFTSAAFSGDANFRSAAFSGDANFRSAAFSRDADFGSAAFSGKAYFWRAAFSRDADFGSAAFAGLLSLEFTYFGGAALFSGAGRSVIAAAERANIALTAIPNETAEGGTVSGALDRPAGLNELARRAVMEINAKAAIFRDKVRFDNREFLQPGSFENAQFFSFVDFSGSALHPGLRFNGVFWQDPINAAKKPPAVSETLLKRLWLAKEPQYQRLSEADPDTQDTFAAWLQDWIKDESAPALWRSRDKDSPEQKTLQAFAVWRTRFYADFSEQLLERRQDVDMPAHYEHCYRVLKWAMEQIRNRNEESRFFRFEIRARQKRGKETLRQGSKKPDVPGWERGFAAVYGGLADYGNSIVRPIFWLIGLFVFGGIGFFGLGQGIDRLFPVAHAKPRDVWRDAFDACTLSWDNIFKPLSALTLSSESASDDHPLIKLLFGGAPWLAFLVRVLATFESISALVLAFLLVLAVRRRFQIS